MKYRAALGLVGPVALAAAIGSATSTQAQEIVQPLPARGSQELADALQRLARDGNDLSALLDAGDASITLGDVTAAIGFFGRAQGISPSSPRVSLGLARSYTLSRRPIEALRLYAEAEKGGIALQTMAADRALAFDLVGNSASAQQLYRLALGASDTDAVRRRLALSQAISGDKAGFEETLLPLLRKGDNAAFRSRSFGLAILGKTDEAIKIARDMMPQALAERVVPYLRYMEQLTPAQQAAAGNLGVFPRTAAIGRDEPDIAAYSSSAAPIARTADARLAPVGPPMAPPAQATTPPRSTTAQSRAERRSGRREMRRGRAETAVAPARSQPSADRQSATQRSEAQANPVTSTGELPPVTRDAAPGPVAFDTQTVQRPPVEAPQAPPAVTVVTLAQPEVAAEPEVSLAEAFAEFDRTMTGPAAPQAGAVDIRAIEAPREKKEPPKPVAPSRHWVQLATGKDISALAFDWRRIARGANGELAGKEAFTAPWGEANRLLAGPYSSAKEARSVAARLKSAGVDSFAFTSARGEDVFALPGAAPAPAAQKPANPSRHWVQIATGRDRSALAFDWRRVARGADGELEGKGPFVAEWGQATRLLAGPYESPGAAREIVNRLKSKGIDSFTFTNEAGEAVEKLD